MKDKAIGTNLIWDWPVRIMHWSLVLLLALLWWTAENDQMDLHRYAGYVMMALLVFRLYWGFAGSNTARFSHFVQSPATTWRYATHILKPQSEPNFGHNPLGAYSVVLLLLLLCVQVILGLFAIDVDGWEAGPLNSYVSFETGRLCATWHEYVFNMLLAWVVLHVLAISYYFFARKQNLLSAMLSGKSGQLKNTGFKAAPAIHYFIGLTLALGTLWLVLQLE